MRLDLPTLLLAFTAPLLMPATPASSVPASAAKVDMPPPLTAEEAARFGAPVAPAANSVARARDIFARERMVLEAGHGLVPAGPWWARPGTSDRPIML